MTFNSLPLCAHEAENRNRIWAGFKGKQSKMEKWWKLKFTRQLSAQKHSDKVLPAVPASKKLRSTLQGNIMFSLWPSMKRCPMPLTKSHVVDSRQQTADNSQRTEIFGLSSVKFSGRVRLKVISTMIHWTKSSLFMNYLVWKTIQSLKALFRIRQDLEFCLTLTMYLLNTKPQRITTNLKWWLIALTPAAQSHTKVWGRKDITGVGRVS